MSVSRKHGSRAGVAVLAIDLILSGIFSWIALGSICRPLVNDPTVWPAGFGGSFGSLGGGGLALRSCMIFNAPPTIDPPFSSRFHTYSTGANRMRQ